jgi:tRNA threonylcarbamoyladenosine biosynthesis protein TsaB
VLLLSLDTCDPRGSVCALRDGVPRASVIHASDEDYSSWLLPAIERCLARAGSSLAQVDAFAVATGPGSFTGVRVGLTTIKGLAEALNRPIAAVSRLFAIATRAAGSCEWVGAVVAAGRGELFAALYQRQKGLLVRHGDEFVGTAAEFLASVVHSVSGGGILWATPDPKLLTREPAWNSRARLGEAIEIINPVLAPTIGLIGYQKFLRGELVDALHLDANYIRRSDAEILWKGPFYHGA